jgi:hypothetical protein
MGFVAEELRGREMILEMGSSKGGIRKSKMK